ncbi:MAG: ribosome maturation factor RimM [Acidimicrobiales bacterium]
MRLTIGRVTKPHGLGGEVVVQLLTDRLERMAPGAELHGPSGLLRVEQARRHGPSWLVRFAGITDRDSAERLRGAPLEGDALTDPEAFWVHELVGAEVLDGAGRSFGKVVAVEANPASDLLVLEDGRLVPLRFVVALAPGRRVTVDPPVGLLDQDGP